jgi:hypothetical protein
MNPKVRFRYDESGEIWAEVNEVITEIDKDIISYDKKNAE